MNENTYNRFVKKILGEIKENENTLSKAIIKELQDYGHKIDLEYIKAILENGDSILKIDELENKKIAISYNGDLEITIQMILFALKNNLSIYLHAEACDVINTCITTLILESMKDSKIENKYIYYSPQYDEIYLRTHQNDYDKIVYIGEPFEYEKFKYFINQEVYFYNYKSYKVYIDQYKNVEQYKELMKFSYMQNITVEVYEDKDEFIKSVSNIDKVIIYTDNKNEENEFVQRLKLKEINFNEFPYSDYKFKINDLVVKLI